MRHEYKIPTAIDETFRGERQRGGRRGKKTDGCFVTVGSLNSERTERRKKGAKAKKWRRAVKYKGNPGEKNRIPKPKPDGRRPQTGKQEAPRSEKWASWGLAIDILTRGGRKKEILLGGFFRGKEGKHLVSQKKKIRD